MCKNDGQTTFFKEECEDDFTTFALADLYEITSEDWEHIVAEPLNTLAETFGPNFAAVPAMHKCHQDSRNMQRVHTKYGATILECAEYEDSKGETSSISITMWHLPSDRFTIFLGEVATKGEKLGFSRSEEADCEYVCMSYDENGTLFSVNRCMKDRLLEKLSSRIPKIKLPLMKIIPLSTDNLSQKELQWLVNIASSELRYSGDANLTVHQLDAGFFLIYGWDPDDHLKVLEYLKYNNLNTLELVVSSMDKNDMGYVHIDPDIPAIEGFPIYESMRSTLIFNI